MLPTGRRLELLTDGSCLIVVVSSTRVLLTPVLFAVAWLGARLVWVEASRFSLLLSAAIIKNISLILFVYSRLTIIGKLN